MGKKYKELSKLKGKIVEEGETIQSVAKKVGITRNTMASKLDGRTAFDITEMQKVAEILNIHPEEIVKYFFADWLHNANK